MLDMVDLFRDQETLDELGIGVIRDSLADALFPGISTLHTRLRYSLFIPWLLERASRESTTDQMAKQFSKSEFRLINSLLAGGETTGVLGRRAGRNLKVMPSSIYWGSLTSWGIADRGLSTDLFFRRSADLRRLRDRTIVEQDAEAAAPVSSAGIDRYLPDPPADLLKSTNFSLTRTEEQYLSDKIVANTAGTALAWLVGHQPRNFDDDVPNVWQLDGAQDCEPSLRSTMDHARRFQITIFGANLLYGLLVAREAQREERIESYGQHIADWHEELRHSDVLLQWDRQSWWHTVRENRPRIPSGTIDFVNSWVELLADTADIATSANAQQLIRRRDAQTKGARSRFVNRAALDRWEGTSNPGKLDFRWNTARPHLRDLYEARRVS
jgi:hypothetical protein